MNSKQTNVFGTDGIRGVVGKTPMTAEFVLKLGWAVGKALQMNGNNRKVLIGKDTRISSYLIESALQAGLAAAGANSYLLGPMPTPGIAYLTRTFHAQVGIVISASHNAYEYNGIKFFSEQGCKTDKNFQDLINQLLKEKLATEHSKELGRSYRINDAAGRYIEYCKSSVPHQTYFRNLKVVLDCANGATYHIAPNVFKELGAEVISMNVDPNGFNINEKCGSTDPKALIARVLKEKADVGIALDGDGDRVIMVDHRGEIVDGDEILYIIVRGMLATQRFKGGVVGTVMSNLGLEIALNDLGVVFLRVPVGDENILYCLQSKDWVLGGEPSGHIIYTHVNCTGDGIIAALQVLQSIMATEKSLHELKQAMKKFPQRVLSVPESQPIDLEDKRVVKAIKEAEAVLGSQGRILVRHSGTEPIVRIMVEGEDTKKVNTVATNLLELLKSMTFEHH